MKNFLKYDFYLQVTVFVSYIIIGLLYGIINDFAEVWLLFYFLVGGIQLLSYLIRFFIGFWKDIFMIIYGIIILPIWIFFLLLYFDISIDSLYFIPIYGLFISPVLAIGYLLYCKDKLDNINR